MSAVQENSSNHEALATSLVNLFFYTRNMRTLPQVGYHLKNNPYVTFLASIHTVPDAEHAVNFVHPISQGKFPDAFMLEFNPQAEEEWPDFFSVLDTIGTKQKEIPWNISTIIYTYSEEQFKTIGRTYKRENPEIAISRLRYLDKQSFSIDHGIWLFEALAIEKSARLDRF